MNTLKTAIPDQPDPNADPNHVLQQQQQQSMVPLGAPVSPAPSSPKASLAIPDYSPDVQTGTVPGGAPSDPTNPPPPLQQITTPTPSQSAPSAPPLLPPPLPTAPPAGPASDHGAMMPSDPAGPLGSDGAPPPPPSGLLPTDLGGITPSGATPLPPASPSTPPSGLTPVDAANNLLGSQINPSADPRLSALQSNVDAAAKDVGSVDREKLAEQMYNTFQQGTDPGYMADVRDQLHEGAGQGIVGGGQLRTRLGNLADVRDQQLDTEKQNLLENAIGGSIQDKLDKVGALSGLEGQQFGEQTTNNNQRDQQQGFQNELSQEAEQSAERQYELEQAAQNQQFNQGATLEQLGEAGNPSAAYAQLAGQLGMDPGAIQALATQLGAKSAGGGAGGAAPGGVDVSSLIASLLGGQQAGAALPGVSTIPNGALPPITGGPSVAPLP